MVDNALTATVLVALAFVGAVLARGEAEPVDARIVFVEGILGERVGWQEASSVTPAVGADVPDGARVGWGGIGGSTVAEAVTPAERVPISPTESGAAVTEPAHALALGQRLHLNTASTAELVALPGIGPALATRIVSHRPYVTLADLDRVPGIGPATLRRLSPLVAP